MAPSADVIWSNDDSKLKCLGDCQAAIWEGVLRLFVVTIIGYLISNISCKIRLSFSC